ncbi:GerAB/ArcD/ProY family transporter [Shouchella lonarensis]|uniref:Spore germination protein (Amino acid permease) n=1 Tax=Shouchella lonarensis TaxID=1464122 RepID=A0A1G6GXN2_9BACI|nr:GerAB/ArcD/ProY family transporter [Shouchella lonarensis]SDB86749.1 spore germination protein (amino acid permease) [Shouchella lonarensis]
MEKELPKHLQVPPYMVFFLVHSMQVGVGVLGFARYIADAAGYQSWIAILLAGIMNQLIIAMMFSSINKVGGGDLHDITCKGLGKWMGWLVTLLFSVYFVFLAVVVLRTYIEVVQVWVYPDLTSWRLAVLVLLVSYYTIRKGFRVITGVTFFFVFLSSLLWPTFFATLEYGEWHHLFPLFHTTLREQFDAVMLMTLSFAGAEVLLVYYPFIQSKGKKKQVRLAAHLGSAWTTIVYLGIAVFTFIYYSHEQLVHVIWPTLSIWKILILPVIERIEYVGIAIWLITIFPNVLLFIWAASRLWKRQFSLKHRTTAKWGIIIVFFLTIQFNSRESIDLLNTAVNRAGPLFSLGLIPFFWLLSLFWKKGGATHEQ